MKPQERGEGGGWRASGSRLAPTRAGGGRLPRAAAARTLTRSRLTAYSSSIDDVAERLRESARAGVREIGRYGRGARAREQRCLAATCGGFRVVRARAARVACTRRSRASAPRRPSERCTDLAKRRAGRRRKMVLVLLEELREGLHEERALWDGEQRCDAHAK
eukprot:4924521-Prymnesium_polylepis.1